MPIVRIVEYGVRCDHPECRENCCHLHNTHTRQQCEAEAIKQGWTRCTRNCWLCPDCTKRHLQPAKTGGTANA